MGYEEKLTNLWWDEVKEEKKKGRLDFSEEKWKKKKLCVGLGLEGRVFKVEK